MHFVDSFVGVVPIVRPARRHLVVADPIVRPARRLAGEADPIVRPVRRRLVVADPIVHLVRRNGLAAGTSSHFAGWRLAAEVRSNFRTAHCLAGRRADRR